MIRITLIGSCFKLCAEINTGKDRFAAYENRYRINVIKKNA